MKTEFLLQDVISRYSRVLSRLLNKGVLKEDREGSSEHVRATDEFFREHRASWIIRRVIVSRFAQ